MIGEKEMGEVKKAAKDLRGICGQGKDSLIFILVSFSDTPLISLA